MQLTRGKRGLLALACEQPFLREHLSVLHDITGKPGIFSVIMIAWGFYVGVGVTVVATPFRALQIGLTASQIGTVAVMESGILIIVMAPLVTYLQESLFGAARTIAFVTVGCSVGCFTFAVASNYPFYLASGILIGAFSARYPA